MVVDLDLDTITRGGGLREILSLGVVDFVRYCHYGWWREIVRERESEREGKRE